MSKSENNVETDSRKRRRFLSLPIYGSAMLVTALGVVLAFQFIKPAPPDRIRIATGEPSGAYSRFAEEYRRILDREGIRLEPMPTSGSVENLERLRRGDVDLAIIQGGISTDGTGSLEGLGNLFFEPLWLFHRSDRRVDRITGLRDLRVAIGPDGSGTQALVRRLLAENHVDKDGTTMLAMDTAKAAAELLVGRIDAAFLVASPENAVVDRLLRSTEVRACSFDRSTAYARRYLFLNELTLPEGTIDFEANIPERDLHLIAPMATLVAGPDLHPAIVGLILQAASEVHGRGGLFEEPRQFPTPDYLEYPLNEHADAFYKHGPPFLQRFLPFWAASLADRLKFMLLPFLVLLLPMFKLMPSLYRWRMRARIYRLYQELEAIDMRFDEGDRDVATLVGELDGLERDVRMIKIPLAYTGQAYILRQHIDLIRGKIRKSRETGKDD